MDETFSRSKCRTFRKGGWGEGGGVPPLRKKLHIGIWNLPLVITQVQVFCLAGLGRRGEAEGAVCRGGWCSPIDKRDNDDDIGQGGRFDRSCDMIHVKKMVLFCISISIFTYSLEKPIFETWSVQMGVPVWGGGGVNACLDGLGTFLSTSKWTLSCFKSEKKKQTRLPFYKPQNCKFVAFECRLQTWCSRF